ncbi:MAG: hypothetical protein A2X23_07650 [Chloroflexi bacterium GWC2_73_18]|nr:MAG: hypothetical protein A2X23_07650 [Chloroflexi bacterium GWC2_73_18]
MKAEAAAPRETAGLRRPPSPGAGDVGRLVLALDLGASRVRAAAVAADGSLLARHQLATPVTEGPEAVLGACVEALRAAREELERSAPALAGGLAAIGVAAPGPLDPWRGVVVDPPNLGPTFREIPLGERIEAALGLPAYVERDTNVAALAEGAFGAARAARDYLYLTVSTGLGGAIVSEGHLVLGPDGTAGELGHLPVELDGPPCGCGGRGHLEAIASGVAVARAARRAVERGESPELERLAAEHGLGGLDARRVAEAETAGDPAATAIMARARHAFAAVCVGLVDVFNPELIVVGGSLARAQGERWLAPARESVARHAFRIPARRARIVPAALGDDVGLVGATVLVRQRAADDRWRGGRPPIHAAISAA